MTNMFRAACLALTIALIGCSQPYKFHGTLLTPPLKTSDFVLTNQDGQSFQLNDLRGKWTLLFFGYTFCPDACPLTLAHFRQIRNALGASDATQVQFVLITVDPRRDSPTRLKEYLAQFDVTFIGLTGNQDSLALVYRSYGVSVEKILADENSAAQNHSHDDVTALFAHTSAIYLLDTSGQVRLIYTAVPWQDVAEDVRHLLAARS